MQPWNDVLKQLMELLAPAFTFFGGLRGLFGLRKRKSDSPTATDTHGEGKPPHGSDEEMP